MRFATAPTSRVPGIGPKTAERLAALGIHTLGHLQRGRRGRLGARFGSNTARFLKARARVRGRLAGLDRAAARRSRARASAPSTRTSPTSPRWRPRSARLSRELVRRARPARPPRAHDRDQGPPRRLDDGHAGAHARGADERRRDDHGDGARAAARVRAAAAGAAARRAEGAAFEDVASRTARRAPPRAGRPARAAVLVQRARRACGARRARAGARPRARRARRRPRAAGPRAGPRRRSRRRSPRSARPARARARPRRAPRTRRAELRVLLEPHPRGEPVGGERAGHVAEQLERLRRARRWPCSSRASATLASAWPGSSSSARRSVGLVAGRDERVGLGRQQLVEEARDLRRRLRADELGRDLAVAERLDGRDALDPERGGEPRVGVRVDLGEGDLALALA